MLKRKICSEILINIQLKHDQKAIFAFSIILFYIYNAYTCISICPWSKCMSVVKIAGFTKLCREEVLVVIVFFFRLDLHIGEPRG